MISRTMLEGHISDWSGVLDPPARQRLENKLDDLEKRTGSRVAALIVPTTRPETIAAHARRVIGENDALLVVAVKDRAVHLEVGPDLAKTLNARLVALIKNRMAEGRPVPAAATEWAVGVIVDAIDAGGQPFLVNMTIAEGPENPVISTVKLAGAGALVLAAAAAVLYGLRRYRPQQGSGTLRARAPAIGPAPALPWAQVVPIVAANLVPLFGVLLLGWQVFALFVMFWLESVVIMVIGALKLLMVRPKNRWEWLLRPFQIPSMLVPVMMVITYGVAIFLMFDRPAVDRIWNSPERLQTFVETIAGFGVLLPLAVVAAIHVFVFLWSFVLGGEWRSGKTPDAGISRLIVAHMTIILGGAAILALGSPAAGLVVLIILKTAMEVAVQVGKIAL
jgi:hypothetical protein